MARGHSILKVKERPYTARYPAKFIMVRGYKTLIGTKRLFTVKNRQSLLWPDATSFLQSQRDYFQTETNTDHNGQSP